MCWKAPQAQLFTSGIALRCQKSKWRSGDHSVLGAGVRGVCCGTQLEPSFSQCGCVASWDPFSGFVRPKLLCRSSAALFSSVTLWIAKLIHADRTKAVTGAPVPTKAVAPRWSQRVLPSAVRSKEKWRPVSPHDVLDKAVPVNYFWALGYLPFNFTCSEMQTLPEAL